MPEGYGKLTTHAGDVYEGNFVYGLKHGTGVELFKDGGSYIGNFKNGLPEGHGKLVDKDGTTFIGQFRKGKKHGAGYWRISMEEKNKDAEFKGELENDMLTLGQAAWGRGVEYKGSFLNNKRHGKGRCTWKNGTVYEGGWADGKANGYGVLTMPGWPEGFTYMGVFKDNLLVEPLQLR